MNQHLKNIQDLLQQNNNLSEADKEALLKAINDADKQWSITDFKLDRTEKVKKTTAILLEETIEELEQKRKAVEAQNRELEIESSLEKVRTVAMGMRKRDDMLDICQMMSKQLEALGIKEIRNVQTAIFYKDKGIYVNYEYYRLHDKALVTSADYTVDQLSSVFAAHMMKGPDEFFTRSLTGKEVQDWYNFQKTTNVFIDTYLAKAESLTYYWFSLGPVAIGISSYLPLSEADLNLFKRFRNVFGLAYQRYIDIEQAESQAREARIEAALEKVRSRSLAVHQSDEFKEVISVVFEKLQELEIPVEAASINIFIEGSKDTDVYACGRNENGLDIRKVKLRYFDHPIANDLYNAHKNGLDFFVGSYGIKEKNSYYEYQFEHGDLKDLPDDIKQRILETESYSLSMAPAKNSTIIINNFEGKLLSETEIDIVKRFARVFEQAYTRFLDLQKAEAQARESQIQLALERVRARTMAMQKSEELPQAANLLFQQIQSLGMHAWSAGYCIWDEDKKAITLWMSSEGVIQQALRMPLTEDPYLMHFREAYERGESFWVEAVGGKELKSHYDYLRTLSGVKESLDDIEAAGFPAPTFQIFHLAYFTQGFLLFITYEPVPESHDIFKRFAKVFEQTYTRFLDLQKSEAQAREAKIETGLERVRSKTMAMQRSEELDIVIKTVYSELKHLDVSFDRCFIMIFDEQKGATWWMGSPEDDLFHEGFYVQYHTHAPHLAYLKGWEERQQKWEYWLGGQIKKNWDEFIFNKTELSKLPPIAIQYMKSFDSAHLAASFENFGCMTTGGQERLSEESFSILSRFAKVFDQTYTRFKDLKQAEAQARESQIQLALERVRARTMAMQKSDELPETSYLLFQQVKELGETTVQNSIGIVNEESGFVELSTTVQGHHLPHTLNVPINDPYVMAKAVAGWKAKRKSLKLEFEGQELKNYNEHRNSFFETKVNFPEDQWIVNIIFFSKGWLSFSGNKNISDETFDLLKRFAAVFEQTYTRFNDLKQAEEQARESQIQLALERVRARTMAMQKSDELAETAALLFKQINDLGIQTWTSGFNIWEKDDRSFIGYNPTPSGGITPPYHIPSKEDSFFINIYEAKKRGEDFFVFESAGESLRETYTYMKTLPVVKEVLKGIEDSGIQLPTFQINHCTFFSHGFLLFITLETYLEAHDIFKRFGKVFEQTYTRFLDLKKAEAQAREAKIEAALEKVRSRTMAMQKSEDLNKAASDMFKQIQLLGMHPWACGFNIFDKDEKAVTQYMSLADGGISPPFRTPLTEDPFFISIYEARQRREDLLVMESSGKELEETYRYMFGLPGSKEIFGDLENSGFAMPKFQITHCAYFSQGYLVFITYEHVTEAHDIFKRFAKVFEQTYTRFLDLQKAEAQAREAMIETALERVRSRSMAMHHSNDLQDVIRVLSDQLLALGLKFDTASFAKVHNDGSWDLWISTPDQPYPAQVFVPYFDHPIFREVKEEDDKKVHFYARSYSLEEKNSFFKYFFENTAAKNIPEARKQYVLNSKGFARSVFFLKNIWLSVANYEGILFSKEENAMLQRFANVFEQTYTRFLDLQKAEAQARESQIELGLERVRARAMAMQKSDELSELVDTVFKELTKLDFALNWCIINIIHEELLTNTVWAANPDIHKAPESYYMKFEDYPFHHAMMKGYKERSTKYVYVLEGQEKKIYDEYLFNETEFRRVPAAAQTASRAMEKYVVTFSFSNFGGLQTVGDAPLSDANIDILSRFGKVFDLTYTRFNDLQKAEAQAREAQIEAALEKVRSRSMGMQKSEELKEVIQIVYEQFVHLNIHVEHTGFIMDYKTRDDMHIWLADKHAVPFQVTIPYFDCAHWNSFNEAKEKGMDFFANHLSFEEKNKFYQDLFKLIPGVPEETLEYYFSCPGLAISTVLLENIGLYIENFSGIPYSDEENNTLMRFGNVFQQTYTRFLDLQKAEAQAREAQIETALERVRSRTLAMQKSDELAETAAVLFQQLILLGIEPNRLYINIIKNETGEAEFWITDEDGSKVSSAFESNMNDNKSFKKMYKGWKEKKKSLMIDMKGKELEEYFEHLSRIHVPFKGGLTQKRRLQYIAYFNKGFIGMASPDEQPEETMLLLERFAAVFNLTFTRFNDLKIAEAHAIRAEEDLIKLQTEKKRAEDALTELQVTQKQLIQSEKMASLGELTAGIAHEIQNPLNFVNNFSDVSNELLEEMKTELEKGNTEDAMAIVDDVKQNLEKILHHGKRADAIVKGMLQHSRSSSGVKEPTDINALADEYLRLAFHGLRAKEKNFNAAMKTDYDETIGLIKIIPQDIGRVILNLITNAFYAVTERKRQQPDGYEPIVSVSTKKINGRVEIKVNDNGTGIPQKVLDKIFQPFFTTKPTGQGTGLGLSLSYDIVKAHGGEIKVVTKESEGTEFIISLTA